MTEETAKKDTEETIDTQSKIDWLKSYTWISRTALSRGETVVTTSQASTRPNWLPVAPEELRACGITVEQADAAGLSVGVISPDVLDWMEFFGALVTALVDFQIPIVDADDHPKAPIRPGSPLVPAEAARLPGSEPGYVAYPAGALHPQGNVIYNAVLGVSPNLRHLRFSYMPWVSALVDGAEVSGPLLTMTVSPRSIKAILEVAEVPDAVELARVKQSQTALVQQAMAAQAQTQGQNRIVSP